MRHPLALAAQLNFPNDGEDFQLRVKGAEALKLVGQSALPDCHQLDNHLCSSL